MNRILFLILLCTALQGCNPMAPFRPDSQKLLSRGWADATPMPEPKQAYCYRTLGSPVCYMAEQVDKESRLVGQYEPYTPIKPKEWWEKFYD